MYDSYAGGSGSQDKKKKKIKRLFFLFAGAPVLERVYVFFFQNHE